MKPQPGKQLKPITNKVLWTFAVGQFGWSLLSGIIATWLVHLYTGNAEKFLDTNGILSQFITQKPLIASLTLFGSLMMTSDNVGDYDEATRRELEEALVLYREAKVTDFSRSGRHINIHYTHNGTSFTMFYDTKKGVLT